MRSFLYRLASLTLRLGCPLAILYLSTPSVLGQYYLFVTYFTFAVFFISLESAIPFSKRYLHAGTEVAKRRVFSVFILSQGILGVVLAAPLAFFYLHTANLSAATGMLFYLTLVAGACANETGRFFWNVGMGEVATRRDVLRSVVFVVAIVGSVGTTDEVVTSTSLGLLMAIDVLLLAWEFRRWGLAGRRARGSRVAGGRLILARVFKSMRMSIPQVLHLQVLASQPFLERALIQRGPGLSIVGSYSFFYAIVQASVSLLLMPAISDTRRAILAAKSDAEHGAAHRQALALLAKLFAVAGACATAAYFLVPAAIQLMHRNIVADATILICGLLSSVASTYTSAIAPLYASGKRIVIANAVTLACMLPMAIVFAVGSDLVFEAIAAVAVCQMLVRVWFLAQRSSTS